jgi:hypothetical protein
MMAMRKNIVFDSPSEAVSDTLGVHVICVMEEYGEPAVGESSNDVRGSQLVP